MSKSDLKKKSPKINSDLSFKPKNHPVKFEIEILNGS